ncbi:DUF5677 domain-containing protein [Sulfurospirillum halorespirans]|uniref:Uncharacterized protein n=1 Tax=Sulfurospirillum halorespirans DSM 13726 TaxID=1193502 RepID=A0A1D7TNJ7_9BACT|nr:DUF5677 domain-containing protein [Sulfurospirillum halorespirans]AOO66567.1 hypothetical protein SHALO_2814 [Sulfurospirillum halorespirans DSM 13726]
MTINDVHTISAIFDKQIKIFKEACEYILHTDTKYSEELFLLLLGISDSLESLSVLSKINKMRDCYVISRMIYETTINVLYISATNFEAMKDMIEYTKEKSKFESARSIATDKEAVFFAFDGEKHIISFSKNNPINMKGDPRDWTGVNISNRINLINKQYGDMVARFLQIAHLTIYRTSSDIVHGTLYGMRHSLGIVNRKNQSFSVEGMINHNFSTIITLMLTVSQCVYSILFAFNKELGLEEYEKQYNQLLEEFLKKGQEVLKK